MKNKGYAKFGSGVRGEVGGGGGKYSALWEMCKWGMELIVSCGPSSCAPSQIRWGGLCDEPKERQRGKLKTLEILYWDLEITILGLFCLKARLAPP